MNAIYLRVSTEEQAKTGYSLEYQRTTCHSRMQQQGCMDIREYVDDGYSGEYLDRPALAALREAISKKTITNLCIYDPDRLSRNLTNQLLLADEMEKAGVQVFFVTGDYDSSPEGRLFFSIRGAIAAFEKAKIRERTQRGRKTKAAAGKIVHNAKPYGYNFDKETSQYIVNPIEAQIVRQIYDLCINQQLGARGIATELAMRGVKGRKAGKPLSASCVEQILTKEMYYGQHFQYRQSVVKTGQNSRIITVNPRDQWIPATVPAIIDYATYQQAQWQRQKNKRLAKRNTCHYYLLQGILHCALCKRKMTAFSRSAAGNSTQGKTYRYYSCITNESSSYLFTERCNCRRIPATELEEAVWRRIVLALKHSSCSSRSGACDLPNLHSAIPDLTAVGADDPLSALPFMQKKAILQKAGLYVFAVLQKNVLEFSFKI